MHAMGFRMALDAVDLVWCAMRDGEFYSPNDLANSLEQPVESVTRVLEFLKKYNFAEQVTRRETIFRKTANNPSPGNALRVLQTVLSDVRVEQTERANISEACKR
jgi:hypothetical protein